MKTTIVKSALLTIESSITPESVKILRSYNPKALELVDEDKNPVFTVAFSESEPSISEYGIVLNEKRLLVISHDKPIDEAFIRTKYGVALTKLKALENQIAEAMQALEASVGQISFDIVD